MDIWKAVQAKFVFFTCCKPFAIMHKSERKRNARLTNGLRREFSWYIIIF